MNDIVSVRVLKINILIGRLVNVSDNFNIEEKLYGLFQENGEFC